MLKQDYFKRLFPAGSGAVPKVIKSSHKTKTVHKGCVLSSYLKNKIDQVLEVMEENIFKHFSISGDEGSGKMSFIELLSDTFHASSHNNLIVVTLEETFDSKNLVGTYVCNESGEFVFKKGPLTVAAEQGLWLVLRHIEKAPSDLLTFLLPLV
jgi:midasin (ATPase involved in ribosome maturation)